MKKRNVLIIMLTCLFLQLLGAVFAGSPYTKPSDGEKQLVQNMIDISDKSAAGWRRAKKYEAEARKRGDKESAEFWKNLANDWAKLYFDTRRTVVKWVDEFYDIPKPPNTTVFFDGKCKGKFGYCKGSKTDIKVGICPADFTDGPDLIASTKIHEMKHAWQIHNCTSSKPGFWDDCTYWGHITEWEAYKESEKAHDDGIIKLEEKQKKRITDRIKHHKEGADKAADKPTTTFKTGDKKEVADTEVEIPFVVHNPTDAPREVSIQISNELGWTMVPPSFDAVFLQPEQEVTNYVMVSIPPDADPYDTSPMLLSADHDSTDVLYLTAVPTVEVTGGAEKSGAPDETVQVDFYLRNRGFLADTFDLILDNPLGWSTTLTSPPVSSVSLAPEQEMHIQADVIIEADPTTFTTNLVFCRAISQSNPVQMDEHWVPVVTEAADVAALGITNPTGLSEIGPDLTPKVALINVGHVDSFFDVYYEIQLPGGGVHASGTKSVSTMIPEEDREIELDPVTFSESGDYTMTVTTLMDNDSEPDNNTAEVTFPVDATSRVEGWNLLMERSK